jgi:cysteine-rich repeat protein
MKGLRFATVLGAAACLGFVTAGSRAGAAPEGQDEASRRRDHRDDRGDRHRQLLITSAFADLDAELLTIRGRNLSTWRPPRVRLGDSELEVVKPFSEDEILALLPPGIAPGSYLLRVQRQGRSKTRDSERQDSFVVAIGPVGPQGEQGGIGPQGEPGPPGVPGNLALANMQCPAGTFLTGFDASGSLVCSGSGGPGSVCGNGVVEAGEQCDDGNITSGDGCDALCRLEQGGGEPHACVPYVSAAAVTAIEAGLGAGWEAENVAAQLRMFGCDDAQTPRDCLSALPLTSTAVPDGDWGVVGGSQVRLLWEVPYATVYFTRSSPDGRYLAHGGGDGALASIIDLEAQAVIAANASSAPAFFPEASGFLFSAGASSWLCKQSVLAGSPTSVAGNEPECNDAGLRVEAHLGRVLDSGSPAGGLRWALDGPFASDTGAGTADPAVSTSPGADVTFTPVVDTGSEFVLAAGTDVATPYQLNATPSPSMRLFATQLGDDGGSPIGYALRSLEISGAAPPYTVTSTEMARYCSPGGRPMFSFDERWLVVHHHATDADAIELGFAGASDPEFDSYRGTSNLYLIDLLTGARTRLTKMGAGQNAVFPHFRSDGWIYFVVKSGSLPEYLVATDAALVLE